MGGDGRVDSHEDGVVGDGRAVPGGDEGDRALPAVEVGFRNGGRLGCFGFAGGAFEFSWGGRVGGSLGGDSGVGGRGRSGRFGVVGGAELFEDADFAAEGVDRGLEDSDNGHHRFLFGAEEGKGRALFVHFGKDG